MPAPFDPSEFSVKVASSKLKDLGNDDLKAIYDAELAGKHRSSLMSAISSAMDLNLEAAEEAAPAPAPAPEPAAKRIDHSGFMRLTWHERKKWCAVGGGKYEQVG